VGLRPARCGIQTEIDEDLIGGPDQFNDALARYSFPYWTRWAM
jgi:hypothetical protein